MKIEIELGGGQQEDSNSKENEMPKYKPETDTQFNIFKKYLKMKNLTDDYTKFLKAKSNMIEKKQNNNNMEMNKPCSKCDKMPCECENEMEMED